MRDFIRESWKTAAAFATGALFLSLIVGLFSRNPFGVVLLRAILLALLFGGLGLGFRYVVRRWLPELSPGAAASEPASTGGPTPFRRAGRGENVDIVLPEENVLGREHYRSADQAAREESGSTEETAQSESQGLGELEEELGDEVAAREAESEDTPGPEIATGDAPIAPMEGGESEGEEELSEPHAASRVDSLPDIPSLEPPPPEIGSGKAGRTRGRARREMPEDAMKGALSGQDPATLARAIRTVLKKDDKG